MQTSQMLELEKAHMSGGIGRRPVAIVRAAGARLWDSDGNEYIDCAAGQGWANAGHSHPEVTGAIQAQAAVLVAHTESSFNDQRALWLGELAAVLRDALGETERGALGRIHACNSGAEAIEAAIKVARYFTGRPGIVAARRGFHGRTLGALSATWNPKYRRPFEPLLPGFSHVPFNDVEAAQAAINDETAAVIVEVVQGEGGVNPARPDYLAALRRLCDERGALLVVDEIQTGFGRTGRWFAGQHFDLQPDVIALGKTLGGGLPMGAIAWREGLGPLKPGTHGSTFGGNPLACAASRAVLRVMQDEQLPERAGRLGGWLLAELRALDAPLVREVRGLGLMVGLELRRKVTPVLKALLERGVWALPAGPTVLRLLPPLVISEEDLQTVVRAIGEALGVGD
ncbi:MAG: aspartate aminotransferase family protein [Anaerolineae bacterium]